MNALDHLLDDFGRIDDFTAEQLDKAGKIVFDAAVARSNALSTRTAPRRRKLILAGAVAAIAAAAVTVIPTVGLGGHKPSAEAEAATVLRAAGTAAGNEPGGWPDAAYWHVRSTYTRDGKTYQREIWLAHHGHGVLHDSGVGDHSLGDGTKDVLEHVDVAGAIPGNPKSGRTFVRHLVGPDQDTFGAGGVGLTWDQLYALPTDPAKLAAVLRKGNEGAGPNPNSELFTSVGDLLHETPAPPALRKALYNVAATIPGVKLVGQVTDSAGRTGTGVERDGETLIIDTKTGALLADSSTPTAWCPMTSCAFSSTYLSQGPADTAPAK